MYELSKLNFLDWVFLGSLLISWLYMLLKAWGWFSTWLLTKGWRWWNRKDAHTLAVDTLYNAFNLSQLKPGETITATAKDGLIVSIHRPREE